VVVLASPDTPHVPQVVENRLDFGRRRKAQVAIAADQLWLDSRAVPMHRDGFFFAGPCAQGQPLRLKVHRNFGGIQ